MPRSYATSSSGTGGGTPAGSDTQIQFNNSGAFGASDKLTFDATGAVLTVGSSGKAANLRLFNGSDSITLHGGTSTTTWDMYFPSSGGTFGQILMTQGASGVTQWISSSSALFAPGNQGDVIINNNGFFGVSASDKFFWDETNKSLSIQAGTTPIAALDVLSAVAQSAGNVGSVSVTTGLESLNTPSGDAASAGAPVTTGSYSGAAFFSYGSGSYIATGNSYSYTIYNIYDNGTKYYALAQAICSAGVDDGSSNPFSISINWAATPNGGNYTGTVIARVTNFGGTQYFDATGQPGVGPTGSITDDGSGTPYNWGSSSFPSGYTASPDFQGAGGGQTYSYDVYGIGVSPSGHQYFHLGDSPSFVDSTSMSFWIGILLHNPNGFSTKWQATLGSSIYKIIAPNNDFLQNTASSSDSSTLTPNSYGYAPTGGGFTPEYYRVTAYKTIAGQTIYGTPSSFFNNFADGTFPWFSIISWSATNADGYIIEYSTDGSTGGITKHFDNGNSNSFYDDNLTVWIGGAATLTPTSLLPPAGLFQRNGSDSAATVVIQDTQISTPYESIVFKKGDNTIQGIINAGDGGFQMTLLNTAAGVFILNSATEILHPTGVQAQGGNGILFLATSGSWFSGTNFGIGTTAPNSQLEVGGSLALVYVAKTSTYTATASDHTIDCTSGTFTVNLPTAVSITGRIYVIKNSGTGVITVASGTQTIDGALTYLLSAQYQSVTVQSNGANWVIIG